MTVNEAFLNCISAFIKGKKLTLELDAAQWRELVKTAQEQKMLPMVFEAAWDSMPDKLRAQVRHIVKQIAVGQIYRTSEFLKLYSELADEGITPLVVKGIVCRTTYEKPDYRASADEDLYIHENYEAFRDVMQSRGFSTDNADKSTANEECLCRNGLVIEGHWKLFPSSQKQLGKLNELSERFWQRAVRITVEGTELLTLEPTDHMIFLLLHAYKHFIFSGVGIRQMCDIAQWAKHYDIDWQRVHNVMSTANAECFAAAIFDAAEKYFGMAFPPMFERADSTALINDALDAGIYGSAKLSRSHSALMTLSAVDTKDESKRNMPIAKSLFPSRESLQGTYPWLKKNGALLPAAWGARIIKYLFTDDSSAAESVRLGNSRIKLLKQYKII